MPDYLIAIFVFALGACVGSFLNVVVYRLPRVEEPEGTGVFGSLVLSLRALSSPPSTCPGCGHRLAWFDNVPVFGWLLLRGKCRYCRKPISVRYPIVEAFTGLLFVFYYVAIFMWQLGPQLEAVQTLTADGTVVAVVPPLEIARHWLMFLIVLYLLGSLVAASLIDAELFIIPLWICWLMALAGLFGNAAAVPLEQPGAMLGVPWTAGLALGGLAGLMLSLVLVALRIMPRSFEEGEPVLEVYRQAAEAEAAGRAAAVAAGSAVDAADLPPELQPPMPPAVLRLEMLKELAFLALPLLLAGVGFWLARGPAAGVFDSLMQQQVLSGLVGSLFGGLVGGFVVWAVRVLGSLAFGKEAMGMGDVHLMLGVGCLIGAGPSTAAFFIAPFFGILWGGYLFLSRRQRELPYGPFLAAASAGVVLVYPWIEAYFAEPLMFLFGL
ncbi:MAG: prepilin peptidase [Phycisphaerae bacterium]